MHATVPKLDSHRRICLGMLVAAATILLPAIGSGADVAVSIHLDDAFVEVIRGMRRAEGLDPPDRVADQRLAVLLERLHEESETTPASSRAVASALPAVRDLICVERG
ncbi:hypothetical protein [Tahibacter caeni]|uniref:hypothetical protein n=1 Tax=Tahibacter caeni TaxID=1453545 RepID=UPI002149310F|nr:hypothetical protein [Tahibacter caeni]